MTRGRKPKPTAKKRLEGNPGKRKLNKREPTPHVSSDLKSKPPIEVRVTLEPPEIEAGCKMFGDRYLPLLKAMQVLTDVDLAAFELMSLHHTLAWSAASIVERDGLILLDKFGVAHKHPALQIMRDNSAHYRAYAAEFGMTPSARSRLEVLPPDEPSQLEMELFGEDAVVRD